MRVLLTGMIAGLDDLQFVQKVLSLGEERDFPINYYSLIEQLEKCGNKCLARMLGTTNYLFEVLREREYAKMGFDLLAYKSANAIIRVPATIEWNYINIKLKDHKYIKEYVQPDVIVTLVDSEDRIRAKLHNLKAKNQFEETIKKQDFSIREILSWMNEEVSLAEDWAKYCRIKHYVIPIQDGVESLYKLLAYETLPSFYVSYSMTHSNPEVRQEINQTINQLNEYGLVIDPQTVEISRESNNKKDKLAALSYTVHRDLHWFVGKVDAIVAIHPYAKQPPLSTGMMDELGHARDYLKKRYMIFPHSKFSPFTTDSYIDRGRVVASSQELFICLEAEGLCKLS
ncbi:MAG: hypothetical protein HRT88_00880 [Lentisphaeraceae bacterium]|nr:hypothetical protein [Lentisphaeraceae bacterium]